MEYSKKIESLMQEAMSKIKNIVDVNTVVGTPIVCGEDVTIIPVTKVTVGFVVGGGEYTQNIPPKNAQKEYPFAGGASAGVSILPIGFLLAKDNNCKFLTTDSKGNFEEILKIISNVTNTIKSKKE